MTKLMLQVLARTPAEPRAILSRDTGVSLSDRVTALREQLRSRGKFSFRRLMSECTSRLEIVVSFMAILELLKSGECDARQSSAWSDIEVVAVRVPVSR